MGLCKLISPHNTSSTNTHTHTHTDAMRSGVLNETVWSFISVPRSSTLLSGPIQYLAYIYTTDSDLISAGQALPVFNRGGREGGPGAQR